MMSDQLLHIIANVLGVSSSKLSDDSSPETISSWDSLATINIAIAIEAELGISLTPEKISKFTSIGKIKQAVQE